MQNWIKILILIFLDKVFEGLGTNNLTKVIKKALIIGGGCQEINIITKPCPFHY
jgi:hypothetical protein